MSRSRGYGMVLCGRGVEEGLRRLGGKEYGVMVVEEGVAWKFWSRMGDDAACEGGGGHVGVWELWERCCVGVVGGNKDLSE